MSEFNKTLIEEVQSFPCLYNKQDKRYMEKDYKNNCWQEIANKLNKTSEECKVRWRHLRETFTRKCKPKLTGSGADDDVWKYFELLLFLKPFIQPRKSIKIENVFPVEISYDNEELDSFSQNNQDIESTDSYIAKTIVSLLGEVPFHNRDNARAEFMQFTFSLKERYVKTEK